MCLDPLLTPVMAGGGHVSSTAVLTVMCDTYSDVCLDPLLTPVMAGGGHVSCTAVLTVMCVLIHYSHL